MSRHIGIIEGCEIVEQDDRSVTFTAAARLDGDGANGQAGQPPCYAPETFVGKTLDILKNAGKPGNWFGVVTDTGKKTGTPVVQGPHDPCPGAYVSATSLHRRGRNGELLPDSSPLKYVDSATVPYVVVPLLIIQGVEGVVMGCRAVVTNTANGRSVEAVVADGGPPDKLGESSLACARAIGVPVNEASAHPANSGGSDAPTIHYQLFPGTAAIVNDVHYPLQPS
jgi:hypothetical protein